MNNSLTVAVLGSTGYVGLELVKILNKHPHVKINFLGCDNLISANSNLSKQEIKKLDLPNFQLNDDFNPNFSDLVFLALPHGVSNKFVKNFFGKLKIIDLSADFRLDQVSTYKKNYEDHHSCSHLLSKFIYGLPELNKIDIKNNDNIAVPGCYPTSILLPLIPLLRKKLIKTDNIIIDSKSGYSGAGKKFDTNNILYNDDLNFYNYNTNNHRHICEIRQELEKRTDEKVNFSFNPHILPIYRGMMSTIYIDLKNNKQNSIKECLVEFSKKNVFINFIKDNERSDFFKIQNTNNCNLKLFNHYDNSKIIIVSIIDNLLKGAAGQAIQSMNIMYNFREDAGLI